MEDVIGGLPDMSVLAKFRRFYTTGEALIDEKYLERKEALKVVKSQIKELEQALHSA